MENENELKEQLQKFSQERVNQCNSKIQDALKQFNCELTTSAIVEVNGEKIFVVLKSK